MGSPTSRARRIAGLLALVLIPWGCPDVGAWPSADLIWTVGTGIAVPVAPDDLSAVLENGVSFGGGTGVYLESSHRMAVRARLNYSYYRANRSTVAYVPGVYRKSVSSGSAGIWDLGIDLKLGRRPTNGNLLPFLSGGFGLSRLAFSDFAFSGPGESSPEGYEGSETDITMQAGLGLDYIVNQRASVFLEGDYRIDLTGDVGNQHLVVKVGVAFQR